MIVTKTCISRRDRAPRPRRGDRPASPGRHGAGAVRVCASRQRNRSAAWASSMSATGWIMARWTRAPKAPTSSSRRFCEPLAALRKHWLVLTGLDNQPAVTRVGEPGAGHGRCSGAFLTGVMPKPTEGADFRAGVSIDQIAAAELGRHTQLASLELGARVDRIRRRLRCRLQLRLHQHALLAHARRRRCRWRTIRAPSSNGCSATAGAPSAGARRGAHAQGPQHPRFGDRDDRAPAGWLGRARSRQARRVPRRRSAISSGGFRRPKSRAIGSCR